MPRRTTRSGVSATSSATGRSRIAASRRCGARAPLPAGNHDLAALGALSLDRLLADAAVQRRWTPPSSTPTPATSSGRSSPEATRPGVELFHGSPRDPVWEYVLSEQARPRAHADEAPLVLVGHSHIPIALAYDDDSLAGGLAKGGSEVDLTAARWLLNPGSVGQPRDGDPRAACLLLDFAAGRASFRRPAYAIELTQAEIRAVGLPEALAVRLARGQ